MKCVSCWFNDFLLPYHELMAFCLEKCFPIHHRSYNEIVQINIQSDCVTKVLWLEWLRNCPSDASIWADEVIWYCLIHDRVLLLFFIHWTEAKLLKCVWHKIYFCVFSFLDICNIWMMIRIWITDILTTFIIRHSGHTILTHHVSYVPFVFSHLGVSVLNTVTSQT